MTTRSFDVSQACLRCGLVSAVLLLLKSVNGYLVCDLTVSAVYLDLATGIALLIACGVAPLLGLIMDRPMNSKGGICCKKFARLLVNLLVFGILALSIVNGALNATGAVKSFEAASVATKYQLAKQLFYQLRLDPFDLCAGGSNKEIKAFYLANKPSFLSIQRGDAILQLLLCLAWIDQAVVLVYNLCKRGLPRGLQPSNQDYSVQDDLESSGAELVGVLPMVPYDSSDDEWAMPSTSPEETIAMDFPTMACGSNADASFRIDIAPTEGQQEDHSKDATEQIVDEANIKSAAKGEVKTTTAKEDGNESDEAAPLPRESLLASIFGSFAAR